MGAALLLSTGFKVYDDLFEYSKNLEIFNAAYTELGKNYVDEINPGDLMRKGLDAMFASLDPYTNFYSESQAEEALLDRQGEYSGVGCRLIIKDNYPVVTDVIGGSGFSTADIRPGDILTKIKGQSMARKTIPEVAVFLLGAANTTVEIEIERDGISMQKMVTRTQIRNKNVPYSGMADASTGYIKLEGFDHNAATEVQAAFIKLKQNPAMKRLIFDMRGNGGGLLHEAVNIVGLFVGQNKLVVTMKGRTAQSKKDWLSQLPSVDEEMPLIVLVDSRSASASEVVSGALQDLDRAVIVGRNSFGKGLVQNYLPLPYRTQMKVTTAKYYTPSGRCIQMLDYSHRNPDGSVGSLPDSLRKSYKTAAGRTIYDGGGIKPDVIVEEFSGQALLKMLSDELLIFKFVNAYRNTHETIAGATSFSLEDSDYQKFKESAVKDLAALLKTKFSDNLKKTIPDKALAESMIAQSNMETKLQSEIRDKMNGYNREILNRLENEIVKRYYFGDAQYEYSFRADPDILQSIEVLNNPVRYQKILNP